MQTDRRCGQCGAELAAGATEGLCPRCLPRDGVAAETDAGDAQTVTSGPCAPFGLDDPSRRGWGPLPEVGRQFGAYRLVRLLGKGGMGTVYHAEHLDTGRRVALKVLGHSLDSPDAHARFLREGRLAASINHPNSVYIYGTQEIEGTPVIAMELVAGGTLQDRVRQEGPLPVKEAVDAILQVIAGLEAAQAAGVLHRDVKPSNCFVDADGMVKVGDFGLSISTVGRGETNLTIAGSFLGTPAFSSPEQLRGDELDVRSDIYSVGATLYHLLAARPPLAASDLVRLVAEILDRVPDSPRKSQPAIPQGLCRIVMRCLAKERSSRFSGYGELTDALLPFSSVAPTPSALGMRFMAGVIDEITSDLPVLVHLVCIGIHPVDNLAVLRSPGVALVWLAFAAWKLLYFALPEGVWGCSVGKALFGLRVVKPNGGAAGWPKALLRGFVYTVGFHLPYLIQMAFIPPEQYRAILARDDWLVSHWAWILVYVVLFSAARRGNGFAGLHGLLSNTRVLARPTSQSRPRLIIADQRETPATGARRIGPYAVLESLSRSGHEELLLGYDDKLRRSVWIRMLPAASPPIPALRRDLTRPGRPRWLNGRRSAEECWDAYEAPQGKSLIHLLTQRQPWSAVRFWLLDLAEELHAGLSDRSLPDAIGLDRVWIASDGRAKLLDFPAPGLGEGEPAASLPPFPVHDVASMQRFLNRVAVAAMENRLQAPQATHCPPPAVPVPLHVKPFLKHLGEQVFGASEIVVGNLKSLTRKPTAISSRRRLASIASWPLILVFVVTFSFTVAHSEKKRWDREWAEQHPRLPSLRLCLEAYQAQRGRPEAFRVYLAGHYRQTISDPAFWANPETAEMFETASMFSDDFRTVAHRAVSAYPNPSETELKRADDVVKPLIEDFERTERITHVRSSCILFCLTLVFTGVLGGVSALLFRGGPILRLFGIAVVTKDGSKASRLRMFWRNLIVCVPLLVLGAAVLLIPILPQWYTYKVALWTVVLLYLTVKPVLARQRSGQDRIAGTWLVPR